MSIIEENRTLYKEVEELIGKDRLARTINKVLKNIVAIEFANERVAVYQKYYMCAHRCVKFDKAYESCKDCTKYEQFKPVIKKPGFTKAGSLITN